MKSWLLKGCVCALALLGLISCSEQNPLACDSEEVKAPLMEIIQKHERLKKIMTQKILEGEYKAICDDKKACKEELFEKYGKAKVNYTPIMIFSMIQMIPKENTLTCRVVIKGEIEGVDNAEELAFRYEAEKTNPPKITIVQDK